MNLIQEPYTVHFSDDGQLVVISNSGPIHDIYLESSNKTICSWFIFYEQRRIAVQPLKTTAVYIDVHLEIREGFRSNKYVFRRKLPRQCLW
jgi:hypothetical protein